MGLLRYVPAISRCNSEHPPAALRWGLESGLIVTSWLHPPPQVTLLQGCPPSAPTPQRALCWPKSPAFGPTYLVVPVASQGQSYWLRWPLVSCAGANVPYGMLATTQGWCRWHALAQRERCVFVWNGIALQIYLVKKKYVWFCQTVMNTQMSPLIVVCCRDIKEPAQGKVNILSIRLVKS